MITKEKIQEVVEKVIDLQSQFVVEISVSAKNKVLVSIDSFKGITIDDCISVSKSIEKTFDRNIEDYELEVTSAGLTQPFKVVQQYHKNVGKNIEVLLKTGQKFEVKLISVATNGIAIEKTIRKEGSKKKEFQKEEQFIEFEDIKSTKLIIEF